MRKNNILSMVTIFSMLLIPVLTFLELSGNPAFADDAPFLSFSEKGAKNAEISR